MTSSYLPSIPRTEWEKLVSENDYQGLHDLVTQPLHEELYRRQSFDFIDELSDEQQMLLAYDYVQSQVMQGGFIQFIQNHYISLLLPVIQGLKLIDDEPMIEVLDNVLKVYVLNREALDKETSVNEFAALYQEFQEFETLDEQFRERDSESVRKMVDHIVAHPEPYLTFIED